jgi:D-sedoheptulose 7-phosphate isomerase
MKLSDHLTGSIAAIESVRALETEIAEAAKVMSDALRCGCKIMACGNGGSAAESAHFATELLCRLKDDRPSLAALNLTADGSLLSATANDYGFEQIFARQIEGLGRKGDVLFTLSTSGDSPNIIAGMEAAWVRGMPIVSLLGGTGGKAKAKSTVALVVGSDATAHIQEAHLVIIHVLCSMIEQELFVNLRKE